MGFLRGLFTNMWRRNTVENKNLYKSTVYLKRTTSQIRYAFYRVVEANLFNFL